MGKISFERFAEEKEAIIPIIQGSGKIRGRKVEINAADGWYQFIVGNTVRLNRKATLLEVSQELRKVHKVLTGYAYGDEVVPMNFQNLFSKGFGETVKVWFLNQEPWTAVHFAQLEDGRFYYVDVAFAYHSRLTCLRSFFETEKTLVGERGWTPEEKYYYLLLSLERDTWRHLAELEALKLSEREKKKRAEEFKLNFSDRIKKVIVDAGGAFISLAKRANNRYLVTWRVRGTKQIVKSVIKDNLRIENAGFCLSSHDKEHSLHSIINLGRAYIEESGSLYLTRT